MLNVTYMSHSHWEIMKNLYFSSPNAFLIGCTLTDGYVHNKRLIHHGGPVPTGRRCHSGARRNCKQRRPTRANNWSISVLTPFPATTAMFVAVVAHRCLATDTAISHGRNRRPNPIRSGHYCEMRGSDWEEGRHLEMEEVTVRKKGMIGKVGGTDDEIMSTAMSN